MTTSSHRMRRTATVLILLVWSVVAPGAVAQAADGDVAWSVSPCTENGTIDGRIRLEMQVEPGDSVTDHVLVANASTTEQTFVVYGADAFNTPTGGYDLLAAGQPSTDSGSWVTTDQQQITVPALEQTVVALTVNVPEDAAPGDHPAGIVVSRAHPDIDAQGVVVDTRVAVRLSLRVSGELDPALTVQDVRVDYRSSWTPFGGSDATISYTVKNTGNVTVVGQPRLRVTGPFGITLARKDPGPTQEVLPGQSFTVTSVLAGVPPAVIDTAVVDVTMAAAPGPRTELPLASVTSRRTFAAVPWTGLALLVVVALTGYQVVRLRRARRAESEEMWAELAAAAAGGSTAGPAASDGQTDVSAGQGVSADHSDDVPAGQEVETAAGQEVETAAGQEVETAAGQEAETAAGQDAGAAPEARDDDGAPAGNAPVGLVPALLVAGLLGTGLAWFAASVPAQAATDPTDEATLVLTVPAESSDPLPDSSTSTQTDGGTTTTTTVNGGSGPSGGGGTVPGGAVPDLDAEPLDAPDDAPEPTPSATPTGAMTADTLWRRAQGFTPAQWGLVSVSGALLAGAGGLGGWAVWRRRRDLSDPVPLT